MNAIIERQLRRKLAKNNKIGSATGCLVQGLGCSLEAFRDVRLSFVRKENCNGGIRINSAVQIFAKLANIAQSLKFPTMLIKNFVFGGPSAGHHPRSPTARLKGRDIFVKDMEAARGLEQSRNLAVQAIQI